MHVEWRYRDDASHISKMDRTIKMIQNDLDHLVRHLQVVVSGLCVHFSLIVAPIRSGSFDLDCGIEERLMT